MFWKISSKVDLASQHKFLKRPWTISLAEEKRGLSGIESELEVQDPRESYKFASKPSHCKRKAAIKRY